MKRFAILLGLTLLALCLLGGSSAGTQLRAGNLDPSFGRHGIMLTNVKTPVGEFSACCSRSVAVQANGKVVVAGMRPTRDKRERFVLVRYRPDGAPDRSFG